MKSIALTPLIALIALIVRKQGVSYAHIYLNQTEPIRPNLGTIRPNLGLIQFQRIKGGRVIYLPANMIRHALEYPWPSFRFNDLITPHREYITLGATPDTRQKTYRTLFRGRMADKDISQIQYFANKAWVMGSTHFKKQIEEKTGAPSPCTGRGGDRKSVQYRNQQTEDLGHEINSSDPFVSFLYYCNNLY